MSRNRPNAMAVAVVLLCSAVALHAAEGGKKGGKKGKKDAAAKDGWVELFNGKDLTGWKQLNGTAKYEVQEGCVVGTTAEGSPNSFLCTEKDYGDFELEFEVKDDPRLNSGVQFRSQSLKEFKNGRVHGYQVEIATNNAGRIYDEARRATWLDPAPTDEKVKTAFKRDDWNKFRVVCVGDSIKTWVNGIQVVDIHDSTTPKGFIGLQVHQFKGDSPAQVRWRNIRIKELKEGK